MKNPLLKFCLLLPGVLLSMGLAWAILAPLTALVLALRLYRNLVILGICALVVQVAVVAVLSGSGSLAVAIGHAAVASSLVCALSVLVFGRAALGAVARVLGRGAPAALIAIVLPVIRVAGPDHPGWPASVVLALLALGVYVVVAAVAWPSVGGRTVRLVLRTR